MKTRNIGIDIGAYSLKCVVLEKVKGSYVIKHKETYKLVSDETMDSNFIKKSLLNFTNKYKIRRANLYFAIPFMSPEVQFRFFDMPVLPPKDLARGVRYKIEGSTLTDFDSIYYKWSTMPKDDEECRILAVSVYRNLVHEIKKVKKAGWKIINIEPQVVSLGRIVKKNAVVLDLGHRGTRLIIYRDGFPIFVNTIDIGGKDFTENISRRFPEESEGVKHEFGAVLPDRSIESNPNVLAIADLILETASDLAMELKQTLRVAEVEQGVEFDEIYYTGNGAKLKYLTDYLSAETGCELTPLNLTADDEYPYAVASGASVGTKYLEDINFTKVAIKKKYDPLITLFIILGITTAVQAGTYYLNVEMNKRLEQAMSMNSDVRAEIMNTENNLQGIRSEIQKYREIENALTKIQGQRTIKSDILFELPKKIPEKVFLNSIDVKSEEVIIRGRYESYSDVGILAIALEEIGQVDIQTLDSNSFTIKFKPNDIISGIGPALDPEIDK